MEKNNSIFDTGLSPEVTEILRSSVKWARILGIFMIIASSWLALTNLYWAVKNISGSYMVRTYVVVNLLYVVLYSLEIIPAVMLIKLSSKLQRAVNYDEAEMLAAGFASFRSYLKWAAILVMTSLVFYVITALINVLH